MKVLRLNPAGSVAEVIIKSNILLINLTVAIL